MTHLFSQTVWLVPCYALIGAILAIPWSPGFIRRTGPRPAGYVSIFMTLLAFLHSLLALKEVWHQAPEYLSFSWLHAAGLNITLDLEVSAVTVGAAALITGLNLLTQIYAIAYLEMDWGWARFYSLVALFEAGMCLLVLCNSLFFSYVVLEILTLGTYLIVGMWYNQPLVVTGARDAFLTKRVGDLVLLMAVVALLPIAGTWNYTELAQWAQTANLDPKVATFLTLALIAGPIAKCAQFPLHLWLDEAMEGPYPATILRNTVIVETGAWVLIKLQPVLQLSPVASQVIIWVGAVTAIGASLISIAQIDIKRVLSYLVSAYMGLVFIAVGTGQTQTALILIFTYTIAMSLLVMSTGGIVLNNISQNLTQYGGLWSRRPISGICLLVGAGSLVALPPLGNFWALVEMGDFLWKTQPVLFGVLLAVNGLCAFSLARLFGLMFGGKPTDITLRSPEGLWLLVLPMVGVMGFTLHVPLLLLQWQLLPDLSTLNPSVIFLLVFLTLDGFALGSIVYLNENWQKPVRFGPQFLQDFFAYDLYTEKLYKVTIVLLVGIVSKAVYWFDRFIVDGFVNLVGLATVLGGQSLRYNISGQTQFYVLSILLGVSLLLFAIAVPLLNLSF
ncbi:NAD(P)H-quinone oxidoreductase subunit F [Lusitaniella coriacea LEGE 07157]|uniref:NAD(P)H-quinone oxidoreductase subunit F n=1 Tax=Lusitaniella coriacea LEGE 07157 TaxID=945747 RepID=A0A8J7B756_9CYAN|nr:NAD(P)H-quinone oxidoreductase subunit F [Lusitaniella coriacea]MBE9114946.1 NAD(P)H-quinone oxidoreductase subunit F [Lusitaniella coriacea LEGE 07157]